MKNSEIHEQVQIVEDGMVRAGDVQEELERVYGRLRGSLLTEEDRECIIVPLADAIKLLDEAGDCLFDVSAELKMKVEKDERQDQD